MSRSGHRSTAVRSYKRASSNLVREVSESLQPPDPATSENPKKQKLEEEESCGTVGVKESVGVKGVCLYRQWEVNSQ